MSNSTRHYVTGNTFPIKEQLKALGCRWDGERRAWYAETAEIAAKAQELVAPTPLYNSPPPQDLGTANPAELAAKFGRKAIEGAKVTSFTGYSKSPDLNGRIYLCTGKKLGGKRFVQVAHGKPRYYSRDMLEDFDMFGDQPGWQYQWDGVEVEPNGEELAADAAAAAAAKAKQDAADAAKAKAEAEQAARSQAWETAKAGLEKSTAPPINFTDTKEYLDIAKDARAVKLLLPDGSVCWRYSWSGYDDSRTYYWMPAEHAIAARLAWAEHVGITPESAAEFMAKYAGCEGADVKQAVLDADPATQDRLRKSAIEKASRERTEKIAQEIESTRKSVAWKLIAEGLIAKDNLPFGPTMITPRPIQASSYTIDIDSEAVAVYVDAKEARRYTSGSINGKEPALENVCVTLKFPASAWEKAPRSKKPSPIDAKPIPGKLMIHNFCSAAIKVEKE